MRPSLQAMATAAQTEVVRLLPTAPPEMMAFLAGMKMVLEVVTRDYDTAWPDAMSAIVTLKRILLRGAAIAPLRLASSLSESESAARVSIDLPLSGLEAIRDRLTEALIALQEWLETVNSSDVTALRRDIGAYLSISTDRQVLADSAPW